MTADQDSSVAKSMHRDRIKRIEERKCPKQYCVLEFRAIEAHPQ